MKLLTHSTLVKPLTLLDSSKTIDSLDFSEAVDSTGFQ